MKRKIILIGSFAGGNYGDTLVLVSLVKYLEEQGFTEIVIPSSLPDITQVLVRDILSNNVSIIVENINMRKSIGYRFFNLNVLKHLPAADSIGFTAGTIFFRDLVKPRSNFVFSVFLMTWLLKLYRVKLRGLFVGVNEDFSSFSFFQKIVAKRFLNSFFEIVTRDTHSYNNLIGEGYSTPVKAAYDIGLYHLLKTSKTCETGVNSRSAGCLGLNICEYLGSQVGKLITLAAIADFVNKIGSNFATITWFHTTKRDSEFVKSRVFGLLNDSVRRKSTHVELYNDYRKDEAYQQLSIFIGMRMHSLIPAIAFKVPTIALNYNNKVRALYEEFEAAHAVWELDSLTDLTLELVYSKAFVIDQVSVSKILDTINAIKTECNT